jgi:hypothetical protein
MRCSAHTTPAADSCRTVRADCSTLSPDYGTYDRPPEVSSTAFNAQPPNLQPAPLMDMDFAVIGQLVRRRMPHIRFLSIGSRLCSTLLSDPASRRRPCASLSLLLHQDVKRTYTSKLLNMLGTPTERPRHRRGLFYSLLSPGSPASGLCSLVWLQRFSSCCTPKPLPLSGFFLDKKPPCAIQARAYELENRSNLCS